MAEEKYFGKIMGVKLGFSEENKFFGFAVELVTGGGESVIDSRRVASTYNDRMKISPEAWSQAHFDNYRAIYSAMKDARVSDFNDLVGVPVEMIFEDSLLRSWRVLVEVL